MWLSITANQLTSILNDTLRVTEEDAVSATSEVVPGSSPRVGQKIERLPGVPSHKLQNISTALNTQLTQLLVSLWLVKLILNIIIR
jgi:hypothetical protein